MPKQAVCLLLAGLLLACTVHADDAPSFAVLGARIFVADEAAATRLYSDRLGFPWATQSEPSVPGVSGPRIVLTPATSPAPPAYRNRARAIVNIQVADLWSAMRDLESGGYRFLADTISRNGIGLDATLLTPDGDSHYLMEIRYPEPDTTISSPQVFNLELHVSNLDRSIDFYSGRLGFEQRTDAYRPVMPLWHRNGDFAMVLSGDETRAKGAFSEQEHARTRLILATDDLDAAHRILRAHPGVKIVSPPRAAGGKPRLLFADPDGIVHELWQLPSVVGRLNAPAGDGPQ